MERESGCDDRPVVLPEEEAPPHARQCERCELCRQRRRVVWGEGNPRASILLVLDNPGAREDREGREFVCGTRETLQRGMRAAGLPPDAVYVTYLLKCRPIRAYDKPAARAACFPHLQLQLLAQKPSLLMGFGNTVAEALLPAAEGGVKALRGRWHDYEGTPIRFTYHPLAVRRRPNLLPNFTDDLRALAARWRELPRGRPASRPPQG